MRKTIRAVAVVIHQDKVLLIHRWRADKEYFVFPGGGVEPGESVMEAASREVREETTLEITVGKLLYRHVYDDGTQQYFYFCTYISGEPKLGDGPEFTHLNQSNRYQPEWVDIGSLPSLLVYPLEIRDWLIEDVRNGFVDTPKEVKLRISELRKEL